jgi:hypothetical protein
MTWRACSVQEKCGPTGVECAADDRVCQSDAVQRGLEIVCEVTDAGPPAYVYCPAGTAQRDSSVVWMLLVVAALIAAIGGTVLFIAVRKKA